MELDPAYFIHDQPSSFPSTPPSIPDLPLPPITLPTVPPPSVSPHTTRVSFSGAQSGKMSSGLDLSGVASPYASAGAGAGPARERGGGEAGAGGGLEERVGRGGSLGDDEATLDSDIARARMERASRRTRTLSTDLYSSSSTNNDSRDTASARQNILNLVNAGQQQLGSSSSSTPSLAMFMGGGAKARVHKVGTGMTEAEREETERLEREMAATRARWGNKPEEDTAPPAGGMSLASLMKGGAAAGNAVNANVAKRWQPAEQSPSSQPAPSPKPAPASSFGQTPAPRSLASAFGSTATGPRLNSPSPITRPAAADDGPAHARPQNGGGLGVAMPGLAIERPSSLPSPSAVPPPSSSAVGPESPALVEPKVISRSAPSSTPQPSEPAQNPKPIPFEIDGLASASAVLHTGTPPSSYTSPRLESPSKQLAAANNTLTRLQSSNIVAERLKFAEQLQQQQSTPASPSASAQSSPTKAADKRRSVLERWGRDSPNVFTGQGTSKSQGLPSPGLTPSSWSSKPISSSPPPKQNQEEVVEIKSPSPVEPALIGRAKVEEVPAQTEVVAEEVAPKLVHVTRDRARPSKSTPRTMSSAVATSAATPSEVPTSSFSDPAPNTTAQKTPAPPTSNAPTSGYSKPSWSGAPIGVKEPSKPSSPWSRPEGDVAPERKYSRGVTLPGMGSLPHKSPSPSLPPPRISIPPPLSSPTKSASEPMPASPGRPSVKAAAMRWGKAVGSGSATTLASMQALKQSYGVKVAPRTEPERDVFSEEGRAASVEVRATPLAVSQPNLVASPAAPALSPPPPKSLETVKPAAPAKGPSSSSLVDSIVSLALSHSSSARLPAGETLSLDVFHLNSPTDNPHPIEHNHLFHLDEILGIVHRSESPVGSGEVKTTCFVWRGSEARETPKTGERIAKLGRKTGVEPVEVRYREEPRALVEVFANQLTICRGRREDFNHLDKRLFSVQSHEDVVFVEEVDLSARNICSGYCSVFSLVGEVYAWLGEGSTPSEREACCDFAEAIADGRSVTVLAEGEETALFWHSLDGLEYASAHYWRDRALHPQKVSLIQLDSASDSASRIDSLAVSDAHISLLDGGFAEHWIVVPEKARHKKDELRAALEAARTLASKFEERGFESRTPFHVIVFPSLVPRDVPFLSRQLDFTLLNAGARPTRMNVLTAEEAREQLL
ncbi:hypothetical protein JCM5296_000523 [Sporobolomyces johnsonii]